MQEDRDEPQEELNGGKDKQPSRRGPLSILLPPDLDTLHDARVLAADRNSRITKLAKLVSTDAIITLEFLRIANATFFAADRPAITHAQTAVVRLGSEAVIGILDSLAARPQIMDADIAAAFETLRVLATRTAGVARILSDIALPQVSELAETAGLFTVIGQMLACVQLGKTYVEEAKSRRRNALIYRLVQEHHIDVVALQLDYLRKNGVPTVLFYGLDRELKCKTSTQSSLRFITESAVELVEAFREERWDKYSPAKELPSYSALRLLQLSNAQYIQLYDRLDAYLYNRAGASKDGSTAGGDEMESPLEDDFVEEFEPAPEAAAESLRPEQKTPPNNGAILVRREAFPPAIAQSPSGPASGSTTNFIEASGGNLQQEQQSLGEDAKKVLSLIESLCKQCESAQALLSTIMNLLISDGPFIRAALIVLRTAAAEADIHTAVGEGFVEEDVIKVKDPLSPLALCLTKIQSFNSAVIDDDLLCPLGVSSFAVSPIKIRHDSPVVLYADCGVNKPLPLEARKIFRLVVGLLNQTLPRLPGGLPKRTVSKVSKRAAA